MEPIRNYFNAEKQESMLFVFVGIAAAVFAIYFLFLQKDSFYKGMAYPLIAIALVQIAVGGSVWIRSPKDIERVEQFVRSSPEKIENTEIPRMNVVMKNFVIYRYVEIALLLVGLFAMFYFGSKSFAGGVGMGLFLQSTLMLSLDFFAEKRGADYLKYLQEHL